MKTIRLILAIVMMVVGVCAICYAIYHSFGLMASGVYVAAVIIGLAWTIYEMKHAPMLDE